MFRVFAFVLCLMQAGFVCAAIPPIEREALIALYNSTNGAGWSDKTNWRNVDDTDFNRVGTECNWHGVDCRQDTLFGLVQFDNNLTGSIPSQLGNLSNLSYLGLQHNQLSGSIPPELGTLLNLTFLSLINNQLTGPIPPELGNLLNLENLELSQNHLSGLIPPELGDLASLKNLSLDTNRLSGLIPAELGSLLSLEVLSLAFNQLSGEIPVELMNLTNIWVLGIISNCLFTEDPSLRAWLDSLSSVWDETQTIAPADVASSLPTSSSVLLEWTPIPYSAGAGGYAVFVNPQSPSEAIFHDGFEGDGSNWRDFGNLWVMTGDKTEKSILVDGLESGTTYGFVIRTVTEPHGDNQNQLISGPSAVVHETTTSK